MFSQNERQQCINRGYTIQPNGQGAQVKKNQAIYRCRGFQSIQKVL